MFAYPDVVKLVDFVFVPHDSEIFEQARLSLVAPSVHGLFNDFWIVREDACLEVSYGLCFHADAGTCEVCTSDIYFLAVKYDNLEVYTRTKYSLQAVIENRVFVKVLTKVRAWFFRMNEPYLHTTPNKLGDER